MRDSPGNTLLEYVLGLVCKYRTWSFSIIKFLSSGPFLLRRVMGMSSGREQESSGVFSTIIQVDQVAKLVGPYKRKEGSR